LVEWTEYGGITIAFPCSQFSSPNVCAGLAQRRTIGTAASKFFGYTLFAISAASILMIRHATAHGHGADDIACGMIYDGDFLMG
jgi:hypothetical protein